jgi:hypothetical protein
MSKGSNLAAALTAIGAAQSVAKSQVETKPAAPAVPATAEVLQQATKSLESSPPAAGAKTDGAATKKKKPPIGVMFRLDPSDHAVVTKYAGDMKMSVQELLEHAVNELRRSDGLSLIKGRPRGKKAGSSVS